MRKFLWKLTDKEIKKLEVTCNCVPNFQPSNREGEGAEACKMDFLLLGLYILIIFTIACHMKIFKI